jgi:virulence-associated protein E/bifunctional DNA primase/polymerase-like protein
MNATANVRSFTSAADAAAFYVGLGILPVPVAFQGKKPKGNDWEKLRIDATSVSSYFNGHPQNIGALLGVSALGNSGLTDVDLDAPEALAVASAFLPDTKFVFGRTSKPASHWLYLGDPPVRLQQFRDPLNKKSMLVELRGAKKNGTIGLQTVLPGSVHVSGEPIIFEVGRDYAPTTVAPDDLISAVRAVAAGSLLCRYWPAHGRHAAMLALAASLARDGWLVEDALIFCRALYQAVATHDPAAVSRVDSEVNDSFAKVIAGEPATGFPSLTEHIDQRVVETAFGWLGFKPQPSPRIISAAAGADWQKQLLVTERGVIKPLLANALLVLRNAPEWAGALGYNEFNLCTVARKPAPWPQSTAGANWKDFDDSQLAAWFQRYGIAINSRIAAEAAQTIAQENPFHPVRNYLEPLVWDQTGRIDLWLPTYLGAQDSPYTRAVASRWLISAVARIFIPGCQADCVLLLEGPQGSMKSSALRALAGDEWFSDCASELGGKDSRLDLHGNWIIELGECDRIKRGDLERVKGFLTTRFDKFRPPYGRRTATFPRSCIFAATTNDESSFTDETGNRRFWPVRCGQIDLAALKRDRDQLWAEALAKFRSGTPWWLETKDLNDAAAREQNDRYQPGVWDEVILEWCDSPRARAAGPEDHVAALPFDSTTNKVTISDILLHAIGKPFDRFAQADVMQVQRCLIHDGWKRQSQSRVRGTSRRVRFYVRIRPIEGIL